MSLVPPLGIRVPRGLGVLKQNECVTFNWKVRNQLAMKLDGAAAVLQLHNTGWLPPSYDAREGRNDYKRFETRP